jgi:hypothetical protein
MWRLFLRAQQALPLRDQYQPEVGWARLSRVMSLAPIISLDFSRSNARGRSDLHRPKRRMDVPSTYFPPEHCKIGAAGTQRRRLFVRTASFRLAATDSRGFGASRFVAASRSTGLAGRMRDYASPLQIRATTRVFRGSVDRQAPIFLQESEGGIMRRVRRQPGGDSQTALIYGHGAAGPSRMQAGNAIGRLTARPWECWLLPSW